jgi:hypothetical protein
MSYISNIGTIFPTLLGSCRPAEGPVEEWILWMQPEPVTRHGYFFTS